MTIAAAFADYLETATGTTLGQDLFIGEAPNSNQAPDSIWWIIANGGGTDIKLRTGERVKNYQVQIFYRDRNGKHVYDELYALEEQLNQGCPDLDGFETVEIDALTFPVDNDLDNEHRKVGLLQVNLRIYKGV